MLQGTNYTFKFKGKKHFNSEKLHICNIYFNFGSQSIFRDFA